MSCDLEDVIVPEHLPETIKELSLSNAENIPVGLIEKALSVGVEIIK